jgi:hypothetical protein
VIVLIAIVLTAYVIVVNAKKKNILPFSEKCAYLSEKDYRG